ncbi:MAG: hypothetical protein ACYDGR_16130 [Candidatus Dormibacteria bacterium]
MSTVALLDAFDREAAVILAILATEINDPFEREGLLLATFQRAPAGCQGAAHTWQLLNAMRGVVRDYRRRGFDSALDPGTGPAPSYAPAAILARVRSRLQLLAPAPPLAAARRRLESNLPWAVLALVVVLASGALLAGRPSPGEHRAPISSALASGNQALLPIATVRPLPSGLAGPVMASETVGWARMVTGDRTLGLIRTVDGGRNWQVVTPPGGLAVAAFGVGGTERAWVATVTGDAAARDPSTASSTPPQMEGDTGCSLRRSSSPASPRRCNSSTRSTVG